MSKVIDVEPVRAGMDLPGQCIHIWAVRLRGSDEHVARCRTALSKPELQRADRFRFQHLRRTFILAHGCVRILLTRYLAVPHADIRFGYASRGKPYVAAPSTKLHFNQADSGDVAVFAFAVGCEVGVDVEAVRWLPDMEDLVAHFFSREEAADLLAVPPKLREEAFFAAWTRKEAYIKAVGDGLHIPLDAFRVRLLPGEKAGLVHIGGDLQAAEAWQMHTFSPAVGYLGALAYPGPKRNVSVFPEMEASDLLATAIF